MSKDSASQVCGIAGVKASTLGKPKAIAPTVKDTTLQRRQLPTRVLVFIQFLPYCFAHEVILGSSHSDATLAAPQL